MRRDESDERGGYLAMEGRTCKKEGMRTEGTGGGEKGMGKRAKLGKGKVRKGLAGKKGERKGIWKWASGKKK